MLGGLFLVGCMAGWAPPSASPAPTLILPAPVPVQPTPTALVFLPTPAGEPTPALPPDTGWEPLRPGLERRVITLADGAGLPTDRLYLLRLEPDAFRFSIGYRPRQPQSLAAWQQETEALLVVNGGYFTEEFVATGRIVVDGAASGVGYGDFAGMLAVTAAGPQLRWLRQRPYDPAEPLVYALQSFPLLVRPGGELGFPDEDGLPSRRTVIAQDSSGRFLFLLSTWGSFTLHQLSAYLVASDLELDIALNLDGGTSTGLLLAEPAEEIPTFGPLPVVILVHSRE